MAVIIRDSKEVIQILEAFGLNTHLLMEAHIHFRVEEPVTIDAKYYADIDRAVVINKKYRLIDANTQDE